MPANVKPKEMMHAHLCHDIKLDQAGPGQLVEQQLTRVAGATNLHIARAPTRPTLGKALGTTHHFMGDGIMGAQVKTLNLKSDQQTVEDKRMNKRTG